MNTKVLISTALGVAVGMMLYDVISDQPAVRAITG